jgi:hypothetical protein
VICSLVDVEQASFGRIIPNIFPTLLTKFLFSKSPRKLIFATGVFSFIEKLL